MMLALLAGYAIKIDRDPYGVPILKGASWERAFFLAGYATAQDRLGQMEKSRRTARGRLSEVYGPTFAASDRDVLKVGYTDAELQDQIDALPKPIKAAFIQYSSGVNTWIQEAKTSSKLPETYTTNGFQPEPWTPLDSAAISVRFLQTFGRGGAGEIRNWALAQYLAARPNLKDHVPQVLNDLAWFNDPSATTTVPLSDDPLGKNPPKFWLPNKADTLKHLAALPKVGLFDLLPGIRVASKEASTLVAEKLGVPWKSGSYAMVVSKDRSATGSPLLLGAPQMGWGNPSIVSEMSLQAPGLRVTGMGVPGVPGVMIGVTPDLAWTMTTGVADTEDIVYAARKGDDGYVIEGREHKFETISRVLKIKGQPDEVVVQRRTIDGPVILEPKNVPFVFSRRSSFWKREIQSFEALYGMYTAKTAADVSKNIDRATLNFNAFVATKSGDTAYFYAGNIPKRAEGWDPRFPIPAEATWQGYLPRDQMPHLINPKDGLLANWNNKPAVWWPNGDTPVWGRVFRDKVLRDQLTKPKLSLDDLKKAAWSIARLDDTWWSLKPHLESLPDTTAAKAIKGIDGWTLDGHDAAWLYKQFLTDLRSELFASSIGSLMTPDNFNQALQPSLILNALEGKTEFDWLAGRKPAEVLAKALARTEDAFEKAGKPGYKPGAISFGDQRVPYSNRGTYIQVVELGKQVEGTNVLAPGQAEQGPNAMNQVDLARTWTYKPMVRP